MGYFTDEEFVDKMVAHTVRDKLFLKDAGKVLDADDFKPRKEHQEGYGWPRWVVASLALNYWETYKAPVAGMLGVEIEQYCKQNKVGEKQRQKLLQYRQRLRQTTLDAGQAVTDKIIQYKQEKKRLESLEEMFQLQQQGELTNDRMLEICRDAIHVLNGKPKEVHELFQKQEIERRIQRRSDMMGREVPLLFIDPLDQKIRAIGPGQIGLWLAPWKRGKSLALIHTALAYTLQGLNTVFLSCEDPKHWVEDRFDAAVGQIPLSRLHELPNLVRLRYQQARRMLRARLTIVDATDENCSVSWIDQLLEGLREEGNVADALVIDYDDEIQPPRRYKADASTRRFEFADIYKELRRLAARRQIILWTASQTRRSAQKKKIVSGEDTAEDISKIRKVTLAIGIGQGDFEESFYLWVDAHRMDRDKQGVTIMHNKEKGVFYDRARTRRLLEMVHVAEMDAAQQ